MNKFFTSLSIMAVATFGAVAQTVTYSTTPAEGSVTEFPESVAITFNGCSVIKKGLLGLPNLNLTWPGGTQAISGSSCTIDGINFVVPIPASIDRTILGEWELKLQAGNSMNSVRCEFGEDDAPAANPEGIFHWTVEEAKDPYSIDPAEGTYSELPASFTITFNNAVKLDKALLGLKNLMIKNPEGTISSANGSINGNSITYNLSASINRTIKGEYTLTLPKNEGAYGVKIYDTPDHFDLLEENLIYTYTVGAAQVDPVVYDIAMTAFTPRQSSVDHSVDLESKSFTPATLTFNEADLQAVEGATVTITGPGYEETAELSYQGGGISGDVSVFNATFPKPVYNGNYTVHVAQGTVGNAAFIENNETGRANEEVNYVFEAVNGEDLPENAVQYDLNFSKLNKISLNDDDEYELNLDEYDLNGIQITYPVAGLQALEGASMTITGVEYEVVVPITSISAPFLGTGSVVKFDEFPNPVYNGEYVLTLPKGSLGDADFIANPKTGHANAEINLPFTVIGGKDAPVVTVKYDIDLTAFTPRTSSQDTSVNIGNGEDSKTFETVQLTFNAVNLQCEEGAAVTIEGPGYFQSSGMTFSMNGWNGASCVFKASMGANPVYNGTYTVTIPAGVIGDAEWMEDHTKGRCNKDIVYEFEARGGKDASEMTIDSSLPMFSSIPLSSTTDQLNELELTFKSKVYFNENTSLKVTRMTDLAASRYSNYGTATLTRVSDTVVKVNFNPEPAVTGNMHEYCLTIPQGTFWNEAYENGEEGGKVNGASVMKWYVMKNIVYVDVTNHSPRTDQYVDGFAEGEGIMFQTSNDDAVASMVLSLTEYESGNDTDTGKKLLSNVTCTDKAANGAICWINEGAYLMCREGYWYDVEAEFFNEEGDSIGDCQFEFYGNNDGTVAVVAIDAERGVKMVFNMQGVRVDGENLSNGLYIIDGKKVVVRK